MCFFSGTVFFFFSSAFFFFFAACEAVHDSGQVDRRLHYGVEAEGEKRREGTSAFEKKRAAARLTNVSSRREEH